MKAFRSQLRKAMEKRHISQKELCEKTGIPKSAMSQYLSGAFRPKQERTFIIAQALQTTPEYLLGFTDSLDIPSAPLGIVEELHNASQTIAKNMIMIRQSRNLTQESLACRTNLPIKTITEYENGNHTPDAEELRLIADAFDMSVAALTGISIPYYELSEEGRAFLCHNSPSLEEMGMGFPSPNDEILNKIYHRIIKMTPEQKQKVWDIIKTIFGEEKEPES